MNRITRRSRTPFHPGILLLTLALGGCASSHYNAIRVSGLHDFGAFVNDLDTQLGRQGLMPYDLEHAPKSQYDHAVYHNEPDKKYWRREFVSLDPEMPPAIVVTLQGDDFPLEITTSADGELLGKADKLDRGLRKWLRSTYPQARFTSERVPVYDFK